MKKKYEVYIGGNPQKLYYNDIRFAKLECNALGKSEGGWVVHRETGEILFEIPRNAEYKFAVASTDRYGYHLETPIYDIETAEYYAAWQRESPDHYVSVQVIHL